MTDSLTQAVAHGLAATDRPLTVAEIAEGAAWEEQAWPTPGKGNHGH